jgi:hypothetical protein
VCDLLKWEILDKKKQDVSLLESVVTVVIIVFRWRE